jgi:hypothetical protein
MGAFKWPPSENEPRFEYRMPWENGGPSVKVTTPFGPVQPEAVHVTSQPLAAFPSRS